MQTNKERLPLSEIVVISGKGGTGKSSLCASFAHLASLDERTIICDLDVDAPDLHIILDPQTHTKEDFISGHEAVIKQENCVQCGQCAQHCAFGAIKLENGKFHIQERFCEGCGLCVEVCPNDAIAFNDKKCGEYFLSTSRFGHFVHAQLGAGEENSGRLVTLLKKEARDMARKEQKEIILYDGSPGVGCPVISSLSGVHLAVVVVEPTISGVHDFERITALCDHFKIPVALVINKASVDKEKASELENYACKKEYFYAGAVPFSVDVVQAMVAKKALTETTSALKQDIEGLWKNIINFVNNLPKNNKNLIK